MVTKKRVHRRRVPPHGAGWHPRAARTRRAHRRRDRRHDADRLEAQRVRELCDSRVDQCRSTTGDRPAPGSVRLDLFYEPERIWSFSGPEPISTRPGTAPQATSSSSSRSDSSIAYDRDTKAPIYAMSGIAEHFGSPISTPTWCGATPPRSEARINVSRNITGANRSRRSSYRRASSRWILLIG